MSKPRTEAQKLASRLNGQKSRGPKTAEGKATSARNAITHGLNSASVVLWCEKKEKYDQYLEDLTAEWEPETITELELVTALADAQWQLKRLTAIRTASIDLQMDRALQSFRQDFPASDETTRLALAWQALAVDSRCLGELNRHEAHLRRIVNSSISKLLAIGEARSRQQEQPEHHNSENEPEHQQQQRPVLQIAAGTIAPTSEADTAAAISHTPEAQQKCENEPEQPSPAVIIARLIRQTDLARKRSAETGDSPCRQNDLAA
jgi:hypothetical protein